MKEIRVREKNVDKWIETLVAAGYVAEKLEGPVSHTWGNGCPDPDCCDQHPAFYNDVPMAGYAMIKTNASGKAAHKLWVAANEPTTEEKLRMAGYTEDQLAAF